MKYEVEQKYPVSGLQLIEGRLESMGVTLTQRRVEIDRYYNHPARDFAETDEALRIRHTESGHQTSNRITYKGPRVDKATKTRRELELPLGEGETAAADWHKLLEALGFRPVGTVRKSRRKAHVDWQGRSVEVSLDEVDGLGAFVELELVVDESELDAARHCIAELAGKLGLEGSERRGYLQLLLDRTS